MDVLRYLEVVSMSDLENLPGLHVKELNYEETLGATFSSIKTGQVNVLVVVLPERKATRTPPHVLEVDGVHIPADQVEVNDRLFMPLWRTARSSTASMDEGSVLQLPEDFRFPNRTAQLSIFIRPCYPRLLRKVLELTKNAAEPHVILLGNPGTGKTFFGYLLLWHLIKEDATVVYHNVGSETVLLFTSRGVISGPRKAFRKILAKPTTYYIIDGVAPFGVQAKTILLTSPWCREIWHDLSKDPSTKLRMPVWNWDEVLACRDQVYRHLSIHIVEEHFRRWGGIARYVLEHAEDEVRQAEL